MNSMLHSASNERRALRLGTRGSALAMVQARDIARQLEAAGHTVEIVVKQTLGDQDKTSSFATLGPPGVFVREIESALLADEIDFAVHCFKDLPSVSPAGLVIAAVPLREDPAELLLIRANAHDPQAPGLPLKSGALVGTSAARRQALIRHHRADLGCRELRGNVPTRVRKLIDGDYDAIVLAAAGLNRLAQGAERGENEALDLPGVVVQALPLDTFIPAPSQGALALQARADDAVTHAALQGLNDAASARTVSAERALLALVQAGCDAPFGAYCRALPHSGDETEAPLELLAVFEANGHVHVARATGQAPQALAQVVFQRLGLA
jgi:hydroxymethylbilane synthase